MASMDLLTVCPQCKGVWLTSTMRGGLCHVCAGHLEAAQRSLRRAKPGHVVQRQQVTIPDEARSGIKKAGAMYGVLEREARRM